MEEEKTRHEEKRAQYEEYERQLEDLFRKGNLSREAYLGTKLTLARGLGAEKSYVEWCEVAAGMLSGLRNDEFGPTVHVVHNWCLRLSDVFLPRLCLSMMFRALAFTS